LLKLNLEVVIEKVRALEAELRTLRPEKLAAREREANLRYQQELLQREMARRRDEKVAREIEAVTKRDRALRDEKVARKGRPARPSWPPGRRSPTRRRRPLPTRWRPSRPR